MIPDGAIAGSQIKWRLPDGRWIQAVNAESVEKSSEATVPEGSGPGDVPNLQVKLHEVK